MLDAWIRIDADNTITVFTGKCELGQGIKTALIQVAAEQLGVPPNAITLVTSDTAPHARRGLHLRQPTRCRTAAPPSGTRRRRCVRSWSGLAATRLGVAAEQLKVEGGAVVAPDGKRIPYGELVAGQVLHVQAQPKSNLKDPRSYTIVGQSLPRVDIPAKVTGGVAYVQDLRLDGMVHARVVRPPSYGAKLKRVDTARVEKMPGVKKVVRDGSFLAVIADREFRAVKAMEALAAAAQWDERETMPSQAEFYAWLKQQTGKPITVQGRQGARRAGGEDAGGGISASLPDACRHRSRPARSRSSSTATLTVWSHAQGMFPLRQAVAELLEAAAGARALHPHGRRGLLRPQRRRRRRRRCRLSRRRLSRRAGARAMDRATRSTAGSPMAPAWSWA